MMREYLDLCNRFTLFCADMNPYDVMQDDIPDLLRVNAEILRDDSKEAAGYIQECIDEDLFANENERKEAEDLLSAINSWIEENERGVR